MEAAKQHSEVAKLYEQVLFAATNAQDLFQTAVTILQTSGELMGAVHEIIHSLREFSGSINFPVKLQADLGEISWNVDHVRRACKAKKSATVHFDHLSSVATRVAAMKAFVMDHVDISAGETDGGHSSKKHVEQRGKTSTKRRVCASPGVDGTGKRRKTATERGRVTSDDEEFVRGLHKESSTVDVVTIDVDHAAAETNKTARRGEPRAAKQKEVAADGEAAREMDSGDTPDRSCDEDEDDEDTVETPAVDVRQTRGRKHSTTLSRRERRQESKSVT